MGELLPAAGVAVEVLPRFEAAGGPVSASRVRAALDAGDWPLLSALVPPPTLEHLKNLKGSTP